MTPILHQFSVHDVQFTIGRWYITNGHLMIIAATVVLGLTIVVHLIAVRHELGRFWNWLHFVAGMVGLLAWLLFLLIPTKEVPSSDVLGVVGLGGFWLVGIAGIPLLVREWPRRHRHADGTSSRTGSWWVVVGFPLAFAAGVVCTAAYLFTWV